MPTHDPGVTVTTSPTPDKLYAGDTMPRVQETVVLISGQNLLRGALLGKITASSKYTLSLSAAADGSQTPEAILVDDCNASAADARCSVYLTGEFNPAAMTFGAGHTSASVAAGLRNKGIFLKATVPA
jgi:hypothetical protein